uniref:CRAL-TRIO domain-containing protein n=1 Tax=Macrostomum lignano TaxID=282301 RepID=A0A1I8IVB1_9PLAT
QQQSVQRGGGGSYYNDSETPAWFDEGPLDKLEKLELTGLPEESAPRRAPRRSPRLRRPSLSQPSQRPRPRLQQPPRRQRQRQQLRRSASAAAAAATALQPASKAEKSASADSAFPPPLDFDLSDLLMPVLAEADEQPVVAAPSRMSKWLSADSGDAAPPPMRPPTAQVPATAAAAPAPKPASAPAKKPAPSADVVQLQQMLLKDLRIGQQNKPQPQQQPQPPQPLLPQPQQQPQQPAAQSAAPNRQLDAREVEANIKSLLFGSLKAGGGAAATPAPAVVSAAAAPVAPSATPAQLQPQQPRAVAASAVAAAASLAALSSRSSRCRMLFFPPPAVEASAACALPSSSRRTGRPPVPPARPAALSSSQYPPGIPPAPPAFPAALSTFSISSWNSASAGGGIRIAPPSATAGWGVIGQGGGVGGIVATSSPQTSTAGRLPPESLAPRQRSAPGQGGRLTLRRLLLTLPAACRRLCRYFLRYRNQRAMVPFLWRGPTGGTSAQIAQSTAESKKAMSASSEPSQEQQVKLLAELRQRVAGEEPLPGEDYFQDESASLPAGPRMESRRAAEKQLRGAIDWRRSYKPLTAECRWCIEEPGYHSMRQVGFDLAAGRFDRSLHLLDREREERTMKPGVTTWVFVIDCTGITLPLCNPSLGSGVIGVFSNFYPEHLERIVCVNHSSLFHGVWSAIRVFIDPKTVKKMKFIKGKEKIQRKFGQMFGDELTRWLVDEIRLNKQEPMSEAQEKFWEGPMRPNQHDPRGCPSYVEQFVDPYFLRVKQLELQSGEESTAGGLYRLHPNIADQQLGRLVPYVPRCRRKEEKKKKAAAAAAAAATAAAAPASKPVATAAEPTKAELAAYGSPRWQPATFLSWLASPQAPMTSSSPAVSAPLPRWLAANVDKSSPRRGKASSLSFTLTRRAAPKAPDFPPDLQACAKFNMVNFLKTKADFDNLLTGSQGKLVFEQLATDTPSVLFAKVDVDENADAASAAGIECMPTFKFYKDGKEVDELKGADYDGIVKASEAARLSPVVNSV